MITDKEIAELMNEELDRRPKPPGSIHVKVTAPPVVKCQLHDNPREFWRKVGLTKAQRADLINGSEVEVLSKRYHSRILIKALQTESAERTQNSSPVSIFNAPVDAAEWLAEWPTPEESMGLSR
jgi:hypothetical protein